MGSEELVKLAAILRLEGVSVVSSNLGPPITELPGFTIEPQARLSSCWAAVISGVLMYGGLSSNNQCALMERFIPGCSIAKCAQGVCEGPKEIEFVLGELLGFSVPPTACQPDNPQHLERIRASIRAPNRMSVICERQKHALAIYGFRLDNESNLLMFNPLDVDPGDGLVVTTEKWSYYSFSREFRRFTLIEV